VAASMELRKKRSGWSHGREFAACTTARGASAQYSAPVQGERALTAQVGCVGLAKERVPVNSDRLRSPSHELLDTLRRSTRDYRQIADSRSTWTKAQPIAPSLARDENHYGEAWRSPRGSREIYSLNEVVRGALPIGRFLELSENSLEQLFEEHQRLNSLSEERALSFAELQQKLRVEREIDLREFSDQNSAAALSKIESSLEKLDKIADILRLLEQVGE
jgi:hypothetical protein